MRKILIIANARNRAAVFLPIADQLVNMGVKVTFVSLDKIQGGEASMILKKSRHAYIELPNPGEKLLFDTSRNERFRMLRAIAPSVNEILKSTQPDLVLPGAASYVEDIFLNQSLRMGIKTALMQDGLRVYKDHTLADKVRDNFIGYLSGLVNEWARALYGVSYFFSPFETNRVDRILLFGNNVLNNFAGKGVMREKMVVVGNPLYDSMSPINKDHAHKIRDFFGIDPKTPVVLFGMQCFSRHSILSLDDEVEIVINLIEFFNEFKNLDLIIKLHPENDYPFYQEKFNELSPSDNIHLVKDEFTSLELLSSCSVFMTVYSTMALEALVNHVPVITIDYTKVRHRLKLEPAVFSAQSESDLRNLFESSSWNDNLQARLKAHREEVLDNELMHLGFAAEKAAEEIIRLIKQKS